VAPGEALAVHDAVRVVAQEHGRESEGRGLDAHNRAAVALRLVVARDDEHVFMRIGILFAADRLNIERPLGARRSDRTSPGA
jgi:hypothetical protein